MVFSFMISSTLYQFCRETAATIFRVKFHIEFPTFTTYCRFPPKGRATFRGSGQLYIRGADLIFFFLVLLTQGLLLAYTFSIMGRVMQLVKTAYSLLASDIRVNAILGQTVYFCVMYRNNNNNNNYYYYY